MQDLIKEEEFSEAHYSPWTRFRRYYIIAAAQVTLLVLIRIIFDNSAEYLQLLYFWLPPITGTLMFVSKSVKYTILRKSMLKGLAGLIGVYHLTLTIIFGVLTIFRAIDTNTNFYFLLETVFYLSILFFVQFLVALFGIAVYSHFRPSK